MKPDLGAPYTPGFRGAFPGMLPQDTDAWRAFLNTYNLGLHTIYYNVRVGTGTTAPPAADQFVLDQLLALSRERIDAVGVSPTTTWLLEVTTDAGLRSLGQALAYRRLWLEDPPPALPPPQAAIITVHLRPDVLAVAAAEGVQIFPVPPPRA